MASKGRKFEDELKDLEQIVSQIDSGELSLEDAIGAFERGVALVKALNHKLDDVQRKVELLTRNAEGQLESAVLGSESAASQSSEAADDDDIPF
ncbi:MAG TPA: exodeoxyribonuclease VII small subunit [Candidatus Binataceae bacterium]|nr:exodeoxyribonuclease VII small subunit [Candidatus Binataceae bacterium]